jgi:hypothetical protein
MSIQIITWYDTVSPESAEQGEYESTGNDERVYRFDPVELAEAVAEFRSMVEQGAWETTDIRVNEVLYSADPSLDYRTGHEDSDCLVLHIDDPELRKKAQALIDSWD